MIKGILFDVDGVLIDSEGLLQRAYKDVFARRGIKIKQESFTKATGTSDEDTIRIVASDVGAEIHDVEGFIKELYCVEYPRVIKDKLKPFPGVISFINMAKAAGLKLAVATSGEIIKLRSSMREIGFDLGFFDFISTRDMVKEAKPAPDLYLKAAEGLGLKNSECIVFEDAYTGIQSGKSAGSICLGITNSFSRDVLLEYGADLVIDSMSDIPDFTGCDEFNKIIETMSEGDKK